LQSGSLTTLRKSLIKIDGEVVRHARALTFPMAGVEAPRALFAAILGRIGRLRAKPSPERSFIVGGRDWRRTEEGRDGLR
jgi:hypothetical protein